MAEQTDYKALALVAIVAISSIYIMSTAVELEAVELPVFEFNPSITGHATAIRESNPNPPKVIKDGEGDWDYDGDGKYTKIDASILADAIDNNACPFRKDCDFTNDGVVDMRDLARFNNFLLSQ